MIRAAALRDKGREVGTVQFFPVPALGALDYRCQPAPQLLTEDQARQASVSRAPGGRRGTIGNREWREAP